MKNDLTHICVRACVRVCLCVKKRFSYTDTPFTNNLAFDTELTEDLI